MEEKPIECALCKREAVILYKEVVGGKLSVSSMCAHCPLLSKKMLCCGKRAYSLPKGEKSSLACSSCQTNAEAILTGERLGCPQCYQVFEKILAQELMTTGETPMPDREKKVSFHLGNTPEKLQESHLSLRLEALQVALGEALALENYERAAGIRDQIKDILEGKDGREPKAS